MSEPLSTGASGVPSSPTPPPDGGVSEKGTFLGCKTRLKISNHETGINYYNALVGPILEFLTFAVRVKIGDETFYVNAKSLAKFSLSANNKKTPTDKKIKFLANEFINKAQTTSGETLEFVLALKKVGQVSARHSMQPVAILKKYYSIAELKKEGFSVPELKDHYSAKELKDVGFKLPELKSHYSVNDLRKAGFKPHEMKKEGMTLEEVAGKEEKKSRSVAEGTFDYEIIQAFRRGEDQPPATNPTEKLSTYFLISALRGADVSAKELLEEGVSPLDLFRGGYSREILKKEGHDVDKLLAAEAKAKAAGKIQHAFRANRAKLRLQAREKKYKLDPTYQDVLRKIDAGDSVNLAPDLARLTPDQFLFAFRYLVSRRDDQGRLLMNTDVQKAFEKHLIDTFKLEGAGFDSYRTFDVQGIAELVEYYKLVCPDLSKYKDCKIVSLFNEKEGWNPIQQGSEERFFLADMTFKGKTIGHVVGLYVNYDKKVAYYFDSLGVVAAQEVKAIQEKLGGGFTIMTGKTGIQHDGHNCMVFATACMANIAQSRDSFSQRLCDMAASSKEKVILQESLIPEALMMAQSLSLLTKYDTWFSLIGSFSPESELNDITNKFNQTVVAPIDEELKKLEEGKKILEEKLNSEGQAIDSLKKSDSSSSQIGAAFIPYRKTKEELRRLNINISNIQSKREEAISFRDVWLKILHEDRDLLAKASDQVGKLRKRDGAIRIDQASGNEQNFLMERMRLQTLHYMATKRSSPPPDGK